ncbi:DUF721 domain-containing protein [Ectothiorhodospiraceae bacterium BW-2]|nr:DUF721 domain-containing protein [Ectothiorhodospiraceae bacterium BW-2]
MNPPKYLSHWLCPSNRALGAITHYATHLAKFEQQLRQQLPVALAQSSQWQLANLHNDTLVVTVENGSFATRLRLQQPLFIAAAAKLQPQLSQLLIRIVHAAPSPQRSADTTRQLSERSVETLTEFAAQLDKESPLRAILTRIAAQTPRQN